MTSTRVNRRDHVLVVAGLWIVASVNLNVKVAASYEPRHWGSYYASFAATLSDLSPQISFRWFGPWLAHHLGFASAGSWLMFLYLCFMVAIALWYWLAFRLTRHLVFSIVVALIPVASTSGWYGMYAAGYPDWLVLACLTAGLVVRSTGWMLLFAVVAAWTHERAFFVLLFLPLLRFWLHVQRSTWSIAWQYVGLAGVLTSYFFLRPVLTPLPVAEHAFPLRFYVGELLRGHSRYAPQSLDLQHVLLAGYEGYKALWLVYVGSLVALVATLRNSNSVVLGGGLVMLSLVVIGQLVIAVDSVRVIDFLLFPLITAAICCFETMRDKAGQRWLLGALITALIINQLLPVRYIGQNMAYPVHSRIESGLF